MGPRKGLRGAGRCWEVLGGAGERWDALGHASPLLSDSPPLASVLHSNGPHLPHANDPTGTVGRRMTESAPGLAQDVSVCWAHSPQGGSGGEATHSGRRIANYPFRSQIRAKSVQEGPKSAQDYFFFRLQDAPRASQETLKRP